MAGSNRGSAGAQLPLAVHLRDDATLDNFLPLGGSAGLLPLIRDQQGTQGEPLIYLHGPPGSGRSHLLQGACHLVGDGAVYLPLAEFAGCAAAEVLEGLESRPLVALDDLHAVAGGEDWELSLFNLCNRARESGSRLLVAADSSPRALDVELADLRSRLAWGVVYRLPALSDADKRAILCFRAGRRGLSLSEEVAAYIVNRAPRDTGLLLQLLERLDRHSMAQQRALSIPFVKQVLDW